METFIDTVERVVLTDAQDVASAGVIFGRVVSAYDDQPCAHKTPEGDAFRNACETAARTCSSLLFAVRNMHALRP